MGHVQRREPPGGPGRRRREPDPCDHRAGDAERRRLLRRHGPRRQRVHHDGQQWELPPGRPGPPPSALPLPPGRRPANTDAAVHYGLTGLASGTYTVTPSLACYTFSPASRTVSLSGDTSGIDFSASLVPATFSISGSVTMN